LLKKASPWCTADGRNIVKEIKDPKLRKLVTKAMKVHIMMKCLKPSQRALFWQNNKK
jgi:hypothetical protein